MKKNIIQNGWLSIDAVVKGIGQIIDIKGSYSNEIHNKFLNTHSSEIDYSSLKSDWNAVGGDMRKAMEYYNGRS